MFKRILPQWGLLPLSGSRRHGMGEVSEILASLSAFVYDTQLVICRRPSDGKKNKNGKRRIKKKKL